MQTIGRRRLLVSCACAIAIARITRAQAPPESAQPNHPAKDDPKAQESVNPAEGSSNNDKSGGETPFARLAKLAEYLSQNAVPEALECFDRSMKGYSEVEADITALGAQTDVLCAIDVVSAQGSDRERELDTDWYVELRSQADGGPVERRRERVRITMKRDRRRWKITAMSPVSVLAPIHIQ